VQLDELDELGFRLRVVVDLVDDETGTNRFAGRGEGQDKSAE
jgi:hypothetical protein